MDQHLVHNVAELVPYLAFVLFRIPLPLTPIQILTIDTGTDSVTALELGIEEAHPQAMQCPPRSQKERLMNMPLALRAYLFPRADRTGGGHGRLLLRSQELWLDLRPNFGADRSGVSECHRCLPQAFPTSRVFAGCEGSRAIQGTLVQVASPHPRPTGAQRGAQIDPTQCGDA